MGFEQALVVRCKDRALPGLGRPRCGVCSETRTQTPKPQTQTSNLKPQTSNLKTLLLSRESPLCYLALFFGEKFPKRQDLLDQLHRVIARNPKTTFINTHFGNNAEDLASVAENLDKYPNMFVDIDARISELGRQPYTARKFFLKYQDRILFGTDTTPKREEKRS